MLNSTTAKRLIPRSVKKGLKNFLNSNIVNTIRFTSAYYLLRKRPIIVYQMGKVGSRSIVESLARRGLLVYHAHTLVPDEIMAAIRRNEHTYTGGLRHWYWIYQNIIAKNHHSVKFITLVRDPMAVNVAGFFENLPRFTKVHHPLEKFTLEELHKFFLNEHNHTDYPLEWFDIHMKVVPGIDVYEYPFPKDVGHLTIRKGRFDLLIMKLETDNTTKEKAISDFLGLNDFKLVSTNIGEEKHYAEQYTIFKKIVRIPPEDIERSCNSRYMQHFYTPAEIAAIREKWVRDSVKSI